MAYNASWGEDLLQWVFNNVAWVASGGVVGVDSQDALRIHPGLRAAFHSREGAPGLLRRVGVWVNTSGLRFNVALCFRALRRILKVPGLLRNSVNVAGPFMIVFPRFVRGAIIQVRLYHVFVVQFAVAAVFPFHRRVNSWFNRCVRAFAAGSPAGGAMDYHGNYVCANFHFVVVMQRRQYVIFTWPAATA